MTWHGRQGGGPSSGEGPAALPTRTSLASGAHRRASLSCARVRRSRPRGGGGVSGPDTMATTRGARTRTGRAAGASGPATPSHGHAHGTGRRPHASRRPASRRLPSAPRPSLRPHTSCFAERSDARPSLSRGALAGGVRLSPRALRHVPPGPRPARPVPPGLPGSSPRRRTDRVAVSAVGRCDIVRGGEAAAGGAPSPPRTAAVAESLLLPPAPKRRAESGPTGTPRTCVTGGLRGSWDYSGLLRPSLRLGWRGNPTSRLKSLGPQCPGPST